MPIVLFDGFCSTCNRWSQWISKRDSKNIFELVPQESPEGEDVMISCPESLKDVDSVYIINDGKWFARSSAVCRMLWGAPDALEDCCSIVVVDSAASARPRIRYVRQATAWIAYHGFMNLLSFGWNSEFR